MDIVLAVAMTAVAAVLVGALVLGWLASGVKGSEHGVDPSGEPSGERAEWVEAP